jgi:peptidyl-prolyl cis-trans isomerase A (cyclophilin A)
MVLGCGMSSRSLRCFAIALLATLATCKNIRVKFDVANLDGQPGPDHQSFFVIEVHEDWAPLGVQRFTELVRDGFFKGVRFFRVIDGFMAQFGIHGRSEVSASWREKRIEDDPVKESNRRGTLSFATSGPNTRTTQIFINFKDNSNLDGMGFSPFASVIEGMDVVDRIFKVGEKPDQGQIQSRGNAYLKREFPRLTYITSVNIVDEEDL